jgi:hypothetical protein
MNKELINEIEGAYKMLVSNRFYISRLDNFMKVEVRECAMQKAMRRIEIWDRFFMDEKFAKRVMPAAKKAGFDNVLTYQLSIDLEYCQAEAVINLIDNTEEKTKELLTVPDKETKENLRRPVAFCICLLYKVGRYDIDKMTKNYLQEFVRLNFRNVSAQRIVNTLCAYDLRFEKEKAVFYYNNKTWQFLDDNFEYMKKTYPEDFNKGQELFDKLR